MWCCPLSRFRAAAKSHADGDGDPGAHGLYPLCADRRGSPNAPPAGPELRHGHPLGSFAFHTESAGPSSFFCFKGLYTFPFSGSVIITLFLFFFFLACAYGGRCQHPSLEMHLAAGDHVRKRHPFFQAAVQR